MRTDCRLVVMITVICDHEWHEINCPTFNRTSCLDQHVASPGGGTASAQCHSSHNLHHVKWLFPSNRSKWELRCFILTYKLHQWFPNPAALERTTGLRNPVYQRPQFCFEASLGNSALKHQSTCDSFRNSFLVCGTFCASLMSSPSISSRMDCIIF